MAQNIKVRIFWGSSRYSDWVRVGRSGDRILVWARFCAPAVGTVQGEGRSCDGVLSTGRYTVSCDAVLSTGRYTVSCDAVLSTGRYTVSCDAVLSTGRYNVSWCYSVCQRFVRAWFVPTDDIPGISWKDTDGLYDICFTFPVTHQTHNNLSLRRTKWMFVYWQNCSNIRSVSGDWRRVKLRYKAGEIRWCYCCCAATVCAVGKTRYNLHPGYGSC